MFDNSLAQQYCSFRQKGVFPIPCRKRAFEIPILRLTVADASRLAGVDHSECHDVLINLGGLEVSKAWA